MNPNFKRHSNRLNVSAILRWVVITVFLCASGLSYLYLKNQLFLLGAQRHKMEQELTELIAQNNVLENRISNLTSFSTIQHRMDDGFLKVVPIAERLVVHVRPQEVARLASIESANGNQYRTIAHETAARH